LHIEHLRSEIEQFLRSTEDGKSDVRKETTRNNVAEKLTERQLIILSLIERSVADDVAQNVAVNTKYLSGKLNVNRKTIQRDARYLLEKKLIRWVGSDKTGHWEIIKED
jgi:predicted HTH transcriptional regulator